MAKQVSHRSSSAQYKYQTELSPREKETVQGAKYFSGSWRIGRGYDTIQDETLDALIKKAKVTSATIGKNIGLYAVMPDDSRVPRTAMVGYVSPKGEVFLVAGIPSTS